MSEDKSQIDPTVLSTVRQEVRRVLDAERKERAATEAKRDDRRQAADYLKKAVAVAQAAVLAREEAKAYRTNVQVLQRLDSAIDAFKPLMYEPGATDSVLREWARGKGAP